MYIGTLKDVELACRLHPRMKEFFDFVATHDFDQLPLGRYEIDGDNVFVNNALNDGVEASAQPLEMHRNYLDVHILLHGEETIGWKPLERITTISKEYDPEGDFELSTDTPDTFVTLHPGDFCILFPGDPHAPLISDAPIRKLVGKIRI